MDTALKAEWYDLDDTERDGFLAWLHGEHLPRLQAQPGHIWIGHYDRAPQTGSSRPPGYPRMVEVDDPSVPKGSQYLLLTAAPSTDVFFDPNLRQENDPDTQAQLSKRREYRFGIFVEETRVTGPDWYRHLPGTGAAPVVQFGNYFTRNLADAMDLGYWYRTKKLPQVTRARGCIGARKLVSAAGWANHAILYEFTELDPEEENIELRLREVGLEERWQGRHVLEFTLHAPKGPHAGRRLWPPTGS